MERSARWKAFCEARRHYFELLERGDDAPLIERREAAAKYDRLAAEVTRAKRRRQHRHAKAG